MHKLSPYILKFNQNRSLTNLPKRAFKVLTGKERLPEETPQFMIGFQNGFLSREEPMVELPSKFSALERILQDMPINKRDGSMGLLGKVALSQTVLRDLPLYDVDGIKDSALLCALFRDYAFLASAFLLEECHSRFLDNGIYGVAKDYLPESIAVPFVKVAEKLGQFPFQEYSIANTGYNYRKRDPSKNKNADNLQLVRAWDGGPDENGFPSVHVAMTQFSGEVVKYTMQAMEAAESHDNHLMTHALEKLLETFHLINEQMDTMWFHTRPSKYNDFRTFMMGIKNSPMFPKGVVYRGVSEEPQFYRGPTAANDSLIPTMDNLLEITSFLPKNPLTDILREFRIYRPVNHQEWLQYVEERAANVHVRSFALSTPQSALYYLANLDQVAEFREKHWRFIKEYIIKFSKATHGTGGAPIITWIPNQLGTVMNVIEETAQTINITQLNQEQRELLEKLRFRASKQKRILYRELEKIKEEMQQARHIEMPPAAVLKDK